MLGTVPDDASDAVASEAGHLFARLQDWEALVYLRCSSGHKRQSFLFLLLKR
jgi:hypothetical protein